MILNAVFFAAWIIVNTGGIPGIEPFDPFPFGLLTMAVSLEAILLAIFVLVSQNRSSYINSLREEVHLQVNLIAEEEITKILGVLAEIRKEMGIKKDDAQLKEMLERIDTNYIERSVLEQMERANKSIVEKLVKEFPELMIKKPIEILENIANADAPLAKVDTPAKS